jgi:hypothetical protein
VHLVNGLVAAWRNAIRWRGLAGLVIAQRITPSIRIEERAIDCEGCLHTLGRSRDDELHTPAGIPRGIDARDIGRRVFPTLNTVIFLAKFAAELFRKSRALILSR